MARVAKACRTRSETRAPGQDSLHGREECLSTRCGNAWKQRPRMRISVARVPETCGNKLETKRCWRRFIILSARNARPPGTETAGNMGPRAWHTWRKHLETSWKQGPLMWIPCTGHTEFGGAFVHRFRKQVETSVETSSRVQIHHTGRVKWACSSLRPIFLI